MKYLTVREVARTLRISEQRVKKLIKAKRLEALDVGDTGKPVYRIPPHSLATVSASTSHKLESEFGL